MFNKKGDTSRTKEEQEEVEKLVTYVDDIDRILNSDVSHRLYGVKNYTGDGYRRAGYELLRRFFDGDQWNYSKDGGGTVRVFNYCQPTVQNFTAFLSAESPEVDVPPEDITDDVEVARSEEVEVLLREILDDNQFPITFENAVQNGSLLGDSMIIGPFWDPDEKRIWFENVKKPELVRIIWENTSYNRMTGFVMHYKMSVKEAERVFASQMKAAGIEHLPADEALQGNNQSDKEGRSGGSGSGNVDTTTPMTTIKHYWDRDSMLLTIGSDVLDYVKHDWGFIPLIYVKNVEHPVEAWGISDIENKLDPQVEFNEGNSFISDILKADAMPHIFGKNIELAEFKTNAAQIHDLGDEAEVFNNPLRGVTSPIESYMRTVFNVMVQSSGENEVQYGGASVREATGRALSVLMQSVNLRVKMREKRWRIGLRILNANILRLVELYVEGGKELVQGKYKTDIFFPGSVLRNVNEEINKFSSKLQSLYTTQKNVGIPSPTREQKVMKKELSDPQLSIEISRQPQMQMQFQQMMQQMIQQEIAKQKNTQPNLSEGENQEGEGNPMSASGVPVRTPVSPEGAVRQQAQNAGQAALL